MESGMLNGRIMAIGSAQIEDSKRNIDILAIELKQMKWENS